MSRSVTVIVLAAGRGERFLASGGATHKLDAMLDGKPVLQHVMHAVQACGLDSHLVRPEGGTAGMGDSIALGVKATADAAGWLILPGDLPLVQADSLLRVAQALADHEVVVPRCAEGPGHPVGFRRECFGALADLAGDAGAASVVQARRQDGKVRDLLLDDQGIRFDVDTLEDLRGAERWLRFVRAME